MSNMDMLTRGWRRSVAVLAALTAFGRYFSGVLRVHTPHDEKTAESERAATISARLAEQSPPPSMPIGHRYVHPEPQNFTRFTPIDDNWMMGSPRVILDSVS